MRETEFVKGKKAGMMTGGDAPGTELDMLYMELGKAYYEGAFEDPLPQLLPLFDRISAVLEKNREIASAPGRQPAAPARKPAPAQDPNWETEPGSEWATGPDDEQVTEPFDEPPAEPDSGEPTEPFAEPPVKPADEPAPEADDEWVTEPADEPADEPAPEPDEEWVTEPADEPAPEADAGQQAKPASGPPINKCPACGAVIEREAKFCVKCGARLAVAAQAEPVTCPNCGNVITDDAAFCDNCGTKIS